MDDESTDGTRPAPIAGPQGTRRSDLAPSREISTLLAIMAALRDKRTGCPWDVAQNFATIAPYTIEEAYEVAQSIAEGDMGELREELGDLLLQVVFHAQMAKEEGIFDFGDVVAAISEKLIRRHPHVFGEKRGAAIDEVNVAWERIKQEEKQRKRADASTSAAPSSLLDGIALALPALSRAEKLQARAARVGFDWTTPEPILAKLREEIAECEAALAAEDAAAIKDEVGDLIFTLANLARRLGIDPEQAARHANRKFERRFRAMEASAARSGAAMSSMSLEELETLWVEAKGREPKAG
jgi:ATP diphosphatase